MDAIKIVSLTKKYKDTVAVDNLNLTVKKGEIFSLLGVNGAGKTTTIKILSCLIRPDTGDAFLNSKSVISHADDVKSMISISPQETAVALGLTVRENLKLICGIYKFSKEKSVQKITELSSLLSLDSVLNKKASKLSGGYMRRLSIAMALISEPQILFLDEPTLGLDVIARSQLWDIINKLKGKVTIVLTTHYMEEAQAVSDRVAIMKEGRLLICDTCDNIKARASTNNFEQAFIRIVRGEVK